MKKIFLALALLFPSLAYGQGSNYAAVILGSTGRPVGGAQITVCTAGSPGIPCSPTVNIYQDQALTITQSNPIITDSYGNFSFWAAPGTFEYTVTGLNVVAHGPFTVILPCIVGASCASSGGLPNTAVSFSATPSFAASSNASYAMPLTGNITAITITGTPVNGNFLRFQFTQDATGGRTVSWPANFKIPTTFAFKIQPNENNRMTFLYDGTNWQLLDDIPDGALDYSNVTFSATPTFSNSKSAYFDFNMTGNVTSSTFTTTGRAGTQFVLNACQDGVGGRTFAFPGNVSNPQGFIFDTTANHCNRIYYTWNGTTWNGIGGGTGGGGGGTPAAPVNTFQKNASGSFGSTNVSEVGTTLSVDEDTNFKGPNPAFDLMRYGGYSESIASPTTTTGSINATSTTLTLAAAQNFANGQGIVVQGAGLLPATRNASFPSAPAVGTVTPLGVSNGSTTYNYKFVLEDYFGGLTAAGTQGSTTAGAATLGLNTVALTGVVRSGGVDTFTCSGNCNVAINAQVQISGFASLAVNGTVVVASTPTAGTFTVNAQGQSDYTESASGTLSVRACNALIPSGLLTQESVILRTWIYRGGTLVGVAPGQDPFFIDCNQGVTAPAYVPTSAPGAAQAGYLATTISSGGGTTTLTLANAAGTTVSGQTVQHDNSQPLIAAWTAAYAAHGGTVRIPIIPGNANSSFPFNATTNLTSISNPTNSTVMMDISTMALNQPLIVPGFSEFRGIPQTSTSFQYSPLGSVGGTGQPLILANHATAGGVSFSKLKFAPTATGASSIVLDQVVGGGGEVGFILSDNGYSSNNASPVVIKGGFDFWFTHGVCSTGGSEAGQWFAHPCLEFTNASTYLSSTATQIPGRIKIYDMSFQGGTAIQADNYPSMNQNGLFVNGGLNLAANGVLHESNAGPTIRVATGVGLSPAFGTGLDLSDLVMADIVNGWHQPLVEMTGTSLFNQVTLRNNKAAGTQSAINGGGNFAAPVCINNTFVGCGQTPFYNLNGVNSTLDGGVLGAQNGASFGYLMATPAAPASCVVSAGGLVPITTGLQYFIVAADRSPISFSPFGGLTVLGPACTVNTTGGNQTVTITRPALPAGATGWMVWRGNAMANIGGCVTPIPASTTTFVDTFSFTCGVSAPTNTTAFTAGVSQSGLNAQTVHSGGISGGINPKTSNYTVTITDYDVPADPTGGAFTITLPHAISGFDWTVSNVTAGANLVTVQPDSGTILTPSGAVSSLTLAKGVTSTFYCDGTTCYQKGGNLSSGSGTINPAVQYSDPYYSSPGTSNVLTGLAPQTTNGLYFRTHNVTGGVAVPPTDSFLGVPVNVQTSSYTPLPGDRAGYLLFNSCTTPTLTLPAIAGSFASNMPFRVTNNCSGNLTVTSTSPNSIDGGVAGGSVTLLPNWSMLITQDNTPNWFTVRFPTFSAFASSCTATTFSATNGIICATLPVVSGVNSQTANYLAVAGDNGKIISMNGSGLTLTLPASPPAQPWGIFIENVNASSLTVSRNGLNIDGAASNLTLTQNQGVWLSTDNTNYFTSRGVGGGGGGGSTAWSSLTAPAATLTLSMASNPSEFDFSSALTDAFKFTNNTAATVTTPQASPKMKLACGQEWTGAGASTEGCLQVQYVPGTGLNVQGTVNYTNTSSSTNTNLGHVFTGKLYTATSSGAYNVNTQGNRVAVVDVSGFETGSGTRGFYFANTANIDAGGIDAGVTRLAAGVVSVSNGSANNRAGIVVSGNNQMQVTSSYTNATTTPSTFQTWTLPATAVNYSYECRGVYSSSASTATLALSVNASVAPTNLMASARVYTTLTGTSTDATISTTSSGNQAVLTGATPNATSTNYQFNIYGTIEWPASSGTFAIQAAAGGAGTVTILRGSTCTLY